MSKASLLILAAASMLTTAPAFAAPADTPTHCFFSSQFENWKAPDDKTIYIRVGMHDYYRLDLSGSCPALKWPNAFLITRIHGPSSICTALDWDLHVARSWNDIPEPCIVKKMTELTPAEAAALPKGSKP